MTKSQYESKKITNAKKVGKIVLNVLFYIVMLFFIVVLVFSFIQKLSGKDVYPFFGYRGMIVESGSMSFKCAENAEFLEGHDEQMQVRDLVFTRKLKEGEAPEVYDIVTFKMGDATVIHRVVEIYTDPTTGQTMYVTQGDARPERDAPKSLNQITGIYVGSLGQFGVVIDFLQSAFGIVALIAVIAIILITKVILNYVHEEKDKVETKKDTDSAERDNNTEDCSDAVDIEENATEESLSDDISDVVDTKKAAENSTESEHDTN